MRYINKIFTADIGISCSNQDLLRIFESRLESLGLQEADFIQLRDLVRYHLVGERFRRLTPEWAELQSFESRARAFEDGADAALDALTGQISAAVDAGAVVFDAVITTTSTGHLMPGLSYRAAHRLGSLIRSDSMLLDLGGVGCTGSLKAMNLARRLDASFTNILVVAVEIPSTLANLTGSDPDIWQGNSTFGDGASALWISSKPAQGDMALRLDDIRYTQQAVEGLKLIHWGYDDYYTFKLADPIWFNRDVQTYISRVLNQVGTNWQDDVSGWAIHPAGITLLMRLSRKLGLPRDMLNPSTDHYKQHSNMSSASILYILKDVAESAPVHTSINLLTMGAGFNVIYGRVRKER